MDSVDYYNRYASVYFDNTVNLAMGKTLERFMEYFDAGDAILDLGCGSGRDSKIMLEEGLEVTLLDASEEMCALADIYTGVEPLCMDCRKIDFNQVFDGIWACASLLHLSKKDMEAVLHKVYDSLKTDGIFYFSVKEGDFEGYRHERFFADYTKREMKELLEKFPHFEVIDIWKTQDVRADRNEQKWINVLLKRI